MGKPEEPRPEFAFLLMAADSSLGQTAGVHWHVFEWNELSSQRVYLKMLPKSPSGV